MSKVICVGELLIDFICTDKDTDLKGGVHFIKKAGGAPANVSVAIKKMGADAYILGCVGNDQFGNFLEDEMKKFGVNTDYLIKSDEYDTTLAFVSLSENGERDFIFNRGADKHCTFHNIDKQILEESNVFHFGSATAFLGGELEKTYYLLLEYAISHKKIISFDPNYREALFRHNQECFATHCLSFVRHSHLLKVSEEEATLLTGEADAESAAKKLTALGAQYVLLTLGSKGTLLCHQDQVDYIPSAPVNMTDATGAGDAFIGAVIAKVASRYSDASEITVKDLFEFVKFGNKVGALTVQKYGAMESIPDYRDVEE